jgi:hypothetical protein
MVNGVALILLGIGMSVVSAMGLVITLATNPSQVKMFRFKLPQVNHSIVKSMKTATQKIQKGGVMLKGVQTHESRKRPDARLDRKRWKSNPWRE